jgi:hypothetical protein
VVLHHEYFMAYIYIFGSFVHSGPCVVFITFVFLETLVFNDFWMVIDLAKAISFAL